MKKLLAFILTLVMVASTFTMLPLSVSADTTLEGWDGTTATQPSLKDPTKSNSAANPYLIVSAENLLWMSQQLPQSTSTKGNLTGYYLQEKDIDLNGKSLKSIGWYGTANETDSSIAFAGTYDGNGKKIHNGSFSAQTTSSSAHYGTGLFGVIDGAVIKNVVLDSITIKSPYCVGVLVGRSRGAASTIENCKVTNTCVAMSTKTAINFPATSGGVQLRGDRQTRASGLIGIACNVTITNCVSAATVIVPGNFAVAGGIAGTAAGNSVIKNCVFEGIIKIHLIELTPTGVTVEGNKILSSGNAQYPAQWAGGIVGSVGYGASGSNTGNTPDTTGGLSIQNCLNNSAVVLNGSYTADAVCFGGILGSAFGLKANETYEIKNCYNFTGSDDITNTNNADYLRIAGLVGSAYANKVALTLNNCKTVAIGGETNTSDIGVQGTQDITDNAVADIISNFYNERVSDAAENNTTYEGISLENCSVSTDTVKLAKEADMVAACDLGIQAHSTDAGKYRFFATIDGLNWDEAGFNITVNNGNKSVTKEFFVTVAYNSIEENGVTVTDINGRKFIVLVLENVEADWTFEINAYVEDSTGTYPTTTWTGEFG
ncbi:MAG: hypothetical protein IJZ83_09675 [Clostridia bacterium]|nr:hypothetical protein [Clostridia bacterium]